LNLIYEKKYCPRYLLNLKELTSEETSALKLTDSKWDYPKCPATYIRD